MSKWKVTFLNDSVLAGLAKWPKKLKARFVRITELVEQFGPSDVGMPHVKALGQGLFEIRAKSDEGIGRAFFCYVVNKEVIILHSFIKKTQKTPAKDLKIARDRMKEVFQND
tara:strand:- start:444 stop:779 length:336 start_codon:yes stop_codon:yes gene_type:complete